MPITRYPPFQCRIWFDPVSVGLQYRAIPPGSSSPVGQCQGTCGILGPFVAYNNPRLCGGGRRNCAFKSAVQQKIPTLGRGSHTPHPRSWHQTRHTPTWNFGGLSWLPGRKVHPALLWAVHVAPGTPMQRLSGLIGPSGQSPRGRRANLWKVPVPCQTGRPLSGPFS